MQNASEFLEQLQDINVDKSSESRREILHKITDLFLVTTEQQSEQNRHTFGHIMENIAFELEHAVRVELSDRLADNEASPENLINRLAQDEIDVAKPILERSPVINDKTLANIAKTKGQDHLLAISGRQSLKSIVTDVLVARGDRQVLHKVASNQGADFSRQGFEKLASQATENYALSSTLVLRKDTPADLLKHIKEHISDKLKSELHDSNIDDSEIDEIIEKKSISLEIESEEQKAELKAIDNLYLLRQLDERMINHYVWSNKVVEDNLCLISFIKN